MKTILIATHNKKKKQELKSLLTDCGDAEILTIDDLAGEPPVIVEDGKTFRQNAVKKAVIMSNFFDGLVLADDSGLEVEALLGKPGVRSARFARARATDEENNKKLLNLLETVPDGNRKARFVCHIALASAGQLLDSVEGVVNGRIIEAKKGENGFGYDPLFVPEGYDTTFAEMTEADKNKISHRARALNLIRESILKYL
ncbi:MAG: RdgB/HAM1 family non-canonical purine NTP pyrophosphatase [Candidatus Omnitrophota bacterium]